MNKDREECRFLKACRGEEVDMTPIWLMRQAGRYMQEYRSLREKHSFLTMCKTPELAVEVTMQPVNRLDVDAAILFSDILIPVEAMGIQVEFTEGKGPVMKNPVRDKISFNKTHLIEPDDVSFVTDAIRILRSELQGRVPLIGFSGAPFTLASYIIEAGHSRNFLLVKGMMYQAKDLYEALLDRITDIVITYLKAQIEAGVQAVQLFDTWAGALSPDDYETYALKYSQRIISAIKPSGVPIIYYANGAGTYLDKIKQVGADVIGVDWRIELDKAWTTIGTDLKIQGNLDPVVLLASKDEIRRRAEGILDRAAQRTGHIFNLGHGVLPPTPVTNVEHLINIVHEYSKR